MVDLACPMKNGGFPGSPRLLDLEPWGRGMWLGAKGDWQSAKRFWCPMKTKS